MDLFVDESGPAAAPAIVFLHGGELSGRSWQPVVERMQRYRCVVPDLPKHGNSFHNGSITIGAMADAVVELIHSRVGTGRAHLVGLSLGAQVGAQLMATAPELVDRGVLCGTIVNGAPGVRLTAPLLGAVARISRSVTLWRNARRATLPCDGVDESRDVHLLPATPIAQLVEASARFTVPNGLRASESPTLFLTGSQEMQFVRRSAAALAKRMPNGIAGLATGMDHDWPLRYPDIFARTIDAWFSDTALPAEIELAN